MASNLDRLLSQLNTSGLQQKDNPLYQVIKQLINSTKELQSNLISLSATAGDVDGPLSSDDNAIARFDGITGKIIQNSNITIADGASGTLDGINTGDVTLAGTPDYITIINQVITRGLIDLTTDITGLLPIANMLGFYEPLTDGDTFETDLIYANGEVVMAFKYL